MSVQSASINSIQERVTAICNDLYVKGTKPSVRMVLSMLPDVSSTSTVHKYFAAWKREQDANQQSLYEKLGFSTEFTQSFMKEITRFGVQAEQRYKELAVDANDQRDLALSDLELSEERQYKQVAIVEKQDKQIKELQAELELNQKTQQATVKELRQQLDAKSVENKELITANETQRTELSKAELKLEGNQAYVEEVKSQNLELVKENKQLNKQITELSRELASQESTITGNNKLIEQYESTQANLQQSLSAATIERTAIDNDRNVLRTELAHSNKVLAETKAKYTVEAQQILKLYP